MILCCREVFVLKGYLYQYFLVKRRHTATCLCGKPHTISLANFCQLQHRLFQWEVASWQPASAELVGKEGACGLSLHLLDSFVILGMFILKKAKKRGHSL